MDHVFAQQQAALQVIHTDSDYFKTTHDGDIGQATSMLLDGVNKQWDAMIMDPNNGSMKSINNVRKHFIDTQSDAAVRQVVMAPDDAAVKTPAALESYMTNWCATNYKAQNLQTALATLPGSPGSAGTTLTIQPVVENVDFWIIAPTSLTASQKAAFQTTQNWCHNSFYLDRRATSLVNLFAHNIVNDLRCLPAGMMTPAAGATITGDLWCPTFDAQCGGDGQLEPGQATSAVPSEAAVPDLRRSVLLQRRIDVPELRELGAPVGRDECPQAVRL